MSGFAFNRPEEALLLAENVTMRFGGVTAVSDLSLAIPQGSIVGIIGPNGAGKTTVFNVLSGFYTPQEGSVIFAGKSIKGRKPYQICRLGMARTFQNIRLSSQMTVLENIMVGCHVRRRSSWWMAPLGLPRFYREEADIARKSRLLAERLHLSEHLNEKAGSLPYGAQRRLEIARALATAPRLLLLDEPAAGMNPQESLELMHFIGRIRDEFDLTILLIEHDMKVVMGVCQYIWVMEYGALIAQGDPDAVRSNPVVIRAYLGEDVLAAKSGGPGGR
ncbi:ABC transporter ATP-binding protein [Desulfovibrio sp. ZJ200]|uniref:ABC transporter ATP-binding protein n=1 Tax=Desulfovibrio sp. ZJ200 TaxID=2709792 RepID=UPI0013EDD84F|nr:ABC transporter ATP-binding protein [Desulfovibrio sp. ZJ200]